MARRSYDRMYKNIDAEENNRIAKIVEEKEEKIEDVSLPQEQEVEKKTRQTGRVIGGLSLNVRKKPQANGEIINTVRDGATVEIIETVNEEWYHITSPNGYVMKKYVQV